MRYDLKNRRALAAGVLSLSLVVTALTGCGGAKRADAPESTSASSVTGAAVSTGSAAESEVNEDSAKYSSDIIVKKLENYDPSSIRGVDVSSVLSIMDAFDEQNKSISDESEKLGFRDKDGNIVDRQGFFDLLAASGVNYIRTRVWNDPHDTKGRGYGGGNNTVERAKEIATYATNAGMKNLIDFHLSDFWADPAKQMVPKAWTKLSADKKATEIAKFITASLGEIESDGAVVSMAQVGNETNGSMCGETNMSSINKMIDAGCDAVHDYRDDILAVVHFTEPQQEGLQLRYASQLAAYNGGEGVSYDVFASSYYPYWHGTPENLTNVLDSIAKHYDKYVMVAETSWATRLDDGDGQGNTVSEEKNSTDMPYRFTEQGQADEIRTVAEAVNSIETTRSDGSRAGLGLFYWEPAWIPVHSVEGLSGKDYDRQRAENAALWDLTGSGWASSYSGEYDPNDAGKYYGGSAVDNQAWFDYTGKPLSTLDIYNYLIDGCDAEVRPDGYSIETVNVVTGGEIELPSSVSIVYNDGSSKDENVTWGDGGKDIDTTKEGLYYVEGRLDADPDYTVRCPVRVEAANYMASYDGSFEADPTTWTIDGDGINQEFEDAKNNAVTGKGYINIWAEGEVKGSLTSEEVTLDKAGSYTASIQLHGDVGVGKDKGEKVIFIAKTGDGRTYKSKPMVADGWQNYVKVELPGIKITKDMVKSRKNTVTLSVQIKLGGGRWMAIDDAAVSESK